MKSSFRTVIAAGCCLFVLATAHPLLAQDDPHEVQPERPTVATHAGTVANGWVELEAGGEWDRIDEGVHASSAVAVTKIGLASHVQLSFSTAALAPPEHSLGFGDFAVGVKWRLLDDAPVLGRFAVQPMVKLPTGSADSGTGTGTTDASFLLISSHDLGPVAMDINFSYTRRSGDGHSAPKDSTLWTASFGGPAGGAWGWSGEIFGFPPTSGAAGSDNTVAILFGPTYTARTWLVFDTAFIVPLTGNQPRSVLFGATWNIGQAWKH